MEAEYAAVPPAREQRSTARVQMRGVRRRADVRSSRQTGDSLVDPRHTGNSYERRVVTLGARAEARVTRIEIASIESPTFWRVDFWRSRSLLAGDPFLMDQGFMMA